MSKGFDDFPCETQVMTLPLEDPQRFSSCDTVRVEAASHHMEDAQLSSLFESNSLRGLSYAAKRELSQKLREREFLLGEHLLFQDQLGVGLFIVVQGKVEIRISKEGHSETIAQSKAGEILGEMSLLTGVPCTADVIAVARTKTLLLARNDFSSLKHRFPEIEIALSQLVSDRLGNRETDALSGKRIGNYTLRRCVNRGGMGVVYEAVDDNDKTVALKMLRHRFVHERSAIDGFIQEGRLLSELKHPNVVSFIDCFVAFNTRFLTMDFWSGQDLSRVIRRRGALDEKLCRGILGQVAQGLKYAHAAGILHLDIKPGNILIGADGRVAIADFGLCKMIGKSEAPNSVVGTLAYMPPEQLLAGKLFEAADWYALACTAFEMLTAMRLFRASTFSAAIGAKLDCQPSDQWPKFRASSEMKMIISNALHPEPRERNLDLEQICSWSQLVPGLCD